MDAVMLLGKRSEEIKVLEALGDAGCKEVWLLEGHHREEGALHRKSRQELEAGLCIKEEVHKLKARAEGLLEEASKLRTNLDESDRHGTSRAKEVRAPRDQSVAEARSQ